MKKTLFAIFLIVALVLSGCNLPTPTADTDAAKTLAAQTVVAILTQTAAAGGNATPTPTETLTPEGSPTPTLTATASPTPTVTGTAAPTDKVSFVTDVTVPDGTQFVAGDTFTKTWRLKNTGTSTWTTGYALVFESGDAMGYTAPVYFTSNVAPNQTVDVSVDLVAPASAGNYTGNFKLRNAAGVLFGLGATASNPFWVKIEVVMPGALIVYNFAEKACDAQWKSGAGNLPCPGTDSDNAGFIIPLTSPNTEAGGVSGQLAIETHPQWVNDGYIMGEFPKMVVPPGARFKATIGCLYKSGGSACDVQFGLLYVISGGGGAASSGPWHEVYDGTVTTLDVDLSFLAGKEVTFSLRVTANGPSTQDWAFWLFPRIVR